MAQVLIGDVTFELNVLEAQSALELTADGRTPIKLLENAPDGDVMGKGQIPEATRVFIAGYLAREAEALAEAREATAQQMWAEYIDSWRAAGITDVADEAGFAQALGEAEVSLFVDEGGGVAMAELHWKNRDLFMGHSVFTSVFEPKTWRVFDATLFG